MFGLMRSCSCNKTPAQKELQRLHYCGTCKTIGRLYGQKSRMLLNYDAVFLGEVLTALEPSAIEFAPAYLSRNCLAIPRAEQMPWALQYAATANVVLAQFKISDHVQDTGSRLFKLLGRIFSPQFVKANRALRSCEFPVDEMKSLLSLQIEREREPSPTVDRLAEPTARASQLVFRHGALRTGVSPDTTETMASLGSVFGQIAYLVDAIQDRKEDAKKGAFNALGAIGISEVEAVALLKDKQKEMLGHLRSLPIDEERKTTFASRLRNNLAPILFEGNVLQMGRRWVRTSSSDPIRTPRYRNSNCCCNNCDSGDACDCCGTACCVLQCCDPSCCFCG